MKKTKISFLFVVLVFFSMPALSFSQERYSVSTDKLNVRSGPGSEHEVLWQAEKYYPMVSVKKKGNWIHFKDFEGYEGWVYKPLLSKKKSVVVKVGKCNVRKGPGKSYPIVFTADKGTPFLVISEKKGWYRLKHSDGDTGWVKTTLLW
jgi:SH3-like domain-containing protein